MTKQQLEQRVKELEQENKSLRKVKNIYEDIDNFACNYLNGGVGYTFMEEVKEEYAEDFVKEELNEDTIAFLKEADDGY